MKRKKPAQTESTALVSLDDLGRQFQQARAETVEATLSVHKQAEVAFQKAAACGKILNAAKEVAEHGEFLKWLKSNRGDTSERTCYNWMELAKFANVCKFEQMPSKSKAYVMLGIVSENRTSPRKQLQEEPPPIDVEVVPEQKELPTPPPTADAAPQPIDDGRVHPPMEINSPGLATCNAQDGGSTCDRKPLHQGFHYDTKTQEHWPLTPEDKVARHEWSLSENPHYPATEAEAQLAADIINGKAKPVLDNTMEAIVDTTLFHDPQRTDDKEASVQASQSIRQQTITFRKDADGTRVPVLTIQFGGKDVQEWFDTTPEGAAFLQQQLSASTALLDAEIARLKADLEIAKQPMKLDAEVANAWMIGTAEGRAFFEDAVKSEAVRAEQLTPEAVEAWIDTEPGKQWCIAHDGKVVNHSTVRRDEVPSPEDRRATARAEREAKELATGRCIKLPTGPPLTVALLKSGVEMLVALIPTDADHQQCGEVLSTAAAAEFKAHQAKTRPKQVAFSAYT